MKTLIACTHLVLIIAAWSSPFWLDWRLIALASGAVFVQYLVAGGCVLTQLEAGTDRYATFYHHHLSKLIPKLPKYQIWFFMRYVAPIIIPAFAFWWQVVLQ